jgi:hypothetical protein
LQVSVRQNEAKALWGLKLHPATEKSSSKYGLSAGASAENPGKTARNRWLESLQKGAKTRAKRTKTVEPERIEHQGNSK